MVPQFPHLIGAETRSALFYNNGAYSPTTLTSIGRDSQCDVITDLPIGNIDLATVQYILVAIPLSSSLNSRGIRTGIRFSKAIGKDLLSLNGRERQTSAFAPRFHDPR